METFWAGYPKWLRNAIERSYDYRLADATEDATEAQAIAERFIDLAIKQGSLWFDSYTGEMMGLFK